MENNQHSKSWINNPVIEISGKKSHYRDLVKELGYDPLGRKRKAKTVTRSRNTLENIRANNERVGAEIQAKLTELTHRLDECQQMLEEINSIRPHGHLTFTKRRLGRQELVLVEATKALDVLLKTVEAFEKLEYLHPYWVAIEETLKSTLTDLESKPSYSDWTE